MKHIEIIQKSLESAVSNLLKADAEINSYIKCLVENKNKIVQKNIICKEYKAGDIIKRIDYDTRSINLNKPIKAIASSVAVGYTDIADRIKGLHTYNNNVAHLNIIFLQNPDLLLSKGEATRVEKAILNKLSSYYKRTRSTFLSIDVEEITKLKYNLQNLKHKYSIIHKVEWVWDINELLATDFMDTKLRCGSVYLY